MADPIRLTKGVHTRDIRSSLTPGRTNRVFAALDGPPLRVLEKYPLDVLELGHGLPSGWDGGYFPSERRITVRPSVPREHFGQAFAPGSVQFVTDAAKSETEAIQRNLVHEIGHLLLDQESRAVKRYVKSVFQRNRDAAVSHYGRRNSREFFAESWVAYNFEPRALRRYSQEVYSMVEHVLKEAGIL